VLPSSQQRFYGWIKEETLHTKGGFHMFEKILFPTDFSDVSKKALNFIKQLKHAGTREVVVLHVIDELAIEHAAQIPEAGFNVEALAKQRKEEAEQEMRVIEEELKKDGLNVKTLIKQGIPFRDILKTEEEQDISVVVLGSHGKSCIAEMLLGSVSENVIRKSAKPVFVVRR
jgi:nucleotide-binding universal stress UspA family protein